jgi:hypothetical protein
LHNFSEDKPAGRKVVTGLLADGPIRFNRSAANALNHLTPRQIFGNQVCAAKTASVREQVANCDALFAALREFRNVPGDGIIDRKPAAFDLLRDGNRGHRFSRRKPQAQSARSHRDPGPAFANKEISGTLASNGNVNLRAEVQTLGDSAFD